MTTSFHLLTACAGAIRNPLSTLQMSYAGFPGWGWLLVLVALLVAVGFVLARGGDDAAVSADSVPAAQDASPAIDTAAGQSLAAGSVAMHNVSTLDAMSSPAEAAILAPEASDHREVVLAEPNPDDPNSARP